MRPASVVDLVTGEEAGYRDLYYRWEREQWEAGKIALDVDADAWPRLDAIERRRIADAIDWRRAKAERATTALVAFVDAAPTEEQQVFLTTQLADEARAGVFFDRVASEVFAATEGDMEARSSTASTGLDEVLDALLEGSLSKASDLLRRDGALPQLVRSVARYHLGVVGALGLTELRTLIDRGPAAMPGLGAGLAMIERDATRHVAFALLLLEESAGGQAVRPALEAGLGEAMPSVLQVLGARARSMPELVGPEELQERAGQELASWLRAVGLNLPAIA